jgi:GNAT superfamily N-acetyltransferase
MDCKTFDCDDQGINDFIHSEALDYQRENMGNSYVFTSADGAIQAYFTIFNDALRDLGQRRNWFHRTFIPNPKRVNSYPAIKIGRLGVHKKHHGTGLAYEIMDFIKGWAIKDHKPAVKFLLVDAYNQERQINFYRKNSFEPLPSDKENPETLLMFYPLSMLRS